MGHLSRNSTTTSPTSSTMTIDLSELFYLSDIAHAHLMTTIGIIIITSIVIKIFNIYIAILEPINYEIDMTQKRFCKSLAEIDNSLRFKRGSGGELHQHHHNHNHSNDTQQSSSSSSSGSLDCATDLPLIGPESCSSVSKDNQDDDCADDHNNNNNISAHTGSVNHVYPNGWIPVMESYKLKAGTVKKAIVLGRDVIVTRSANNKEVSVLDAYCPHMGVHIGMGGQVREVDNESCIECPFHGWTFRASDGQCVKIPQHNQRVSKCSIPKQAKLGTWMSVEVDNFIYVWHHIDGQPPSWFLESSAELSQPNWFLAGRSCHKTNLEIRDMHENGADMSHFEGIHNDVFILGSDIIKLQPLKYLQKYIRHHWQPEWKPILENGKKTHMAEMSLQSWMSLFNWRLFDITVNAIQIGPARVKLYYDSKWYGKGLLIMNAIPMGGRRTKYIQHIYTQRTLFQSFMSKWVLYGEIKMLERDFCIWNHKKNIKDPLFSRNDITLVQFRRWYSQFYRRNRTIKIKAQ